MSETVQCDAHGEMPTTFVCIHLTGESFGMGFHCENDSGDKPYPDAWCENCEIIRAQHNGWDDVADDLCKVVVVCSACYDRARIRNLRPTVTLNELAGLRWKCGSCEEWHTGPMLDVGFDQPRYWSEDCDLGSRWEVLPSGEMLKGWKTFLDEDYCAIDDEFFFVRGIIHLPILGAAESFRWGVWGSLSRENFEKLLRMEGDPELVQLPPMFSWLSSWMPDYPDTGSLKMFAHIQEPGMRPHFRLERADHPLAQEYHNGISPERVKEIMFNSLPAQPS
jgi:hypothetical protein